MKKLVSEYVKFIGDGTQPKYSGKTKTMYIPQHLHDIVIYKFGYNLPFTLGIL